ncbi:hypothetical protein [Pseudoxanthomonas sp. X-1]|uniref:hypothetical protein n=1 Tax=Pseudoxanthomonas sp. X-1 TaxID=2571115 RepID=UPI00110B3994|nr:hypothetical protein [Pseudoxanthomonas sp. X-1]TMN18500.1 hypothetical protein FF950_14565 [Pseudoxanthomonas sp. X-1]UAY75993.1 hypothetical protein LAJ50_07085 [Pseudoxanthomonas sp. X-1]
MNDEELLDTIQDAIDGFPTISPEVWQAVKARIDRLARVEALADEWDKTAEVTHYTSGMQVHCSEELRQALKGE